MENRINKEDKGEKQGKKNCITKTHLSSLKMYELAADRQLTSND